VCRLWHADATTAGTGHRGGVVEALARGARSGWRSALLARPGWFLEIDTEKQMRIVSDYGEHEVITTVPQPARHDDITTYDAVTGAHRVRIVIDERPCRDAMSGEAFPYVVVVTIDDRTLRGCGRVLAAEGRP
jgi:uncharacterized membrane protein